jgi:DHA2 family multidrug resistance protein-like MFS transporter
MGAAEVRRAGTREWAGLAVLALPTALLGLDVTLLYLALPVLSLDLRPSSTETLWIMDAYGFLIAGSLITMGTLGDRLGRRRLLMVGAAAFGIASVAAAWSTSPAMLIAARAVLGVAGATLMPSTLALISTMFVDARQRALAIGVWATMFALGMAAGPLVGGVLLESFWWGSAFLVAVPIVATVLLAAPVLLPEYRAPGAGRIDLLSVAQSLAAILPLVYAVKHVAAPSAALLDVRLFADRTFSAALVILLVGLVGVGGAMLLVTQHLQLVEGLPPLTAGAWMGPPALMMLAAAIAAPLVARRVRPGHVVAATLAVSAVGYLLLARVDGPGHVLPVVVGFGFVYLGLGAIAALGTDLVVGAAPPSRAGSAAAMSETVQELGLAVGVALLGSVAAAVYRGRISAAVPAGLPDGGSERVGESLAAATSGTPLPAGLLTAAKEAFTAGMGVAATVAGVAVLVLAVVAATALRQVPAIGDGAGDPGVPAREGADTA